MDLPAAIADRLAGYAFEPISLGESGAAVWRCTMENSPPCYLKAASLDADLRLGDEAERLRWMKQRALPVPAVFEYGCIDGTEWLLLEEVRGVAASDPGWESALAKVVVALGEALALLHRTSVVDCPFDHRIARQIEEARRRVASNLVDEDDFDGTRAGRRATDLLGELVSSLPGEEDLVFTHGDFCLPNIILRETPQGTVQVAGLIDCGRSGIADRYQDLALAIRSITYNFGDRWGAPFLQAYGLPNPNAGKVAFFTLLDEFF